MNALEFNTETWWQNVVRPADDIHHPIPPIGMAAHGPDRQQVVPCGSWRDPVEFLREFVTVVRTWTVHGRYGWRAFGADVCGNVIAYAEVLPTATAWVLVDDLVALLPEASDDPLLNLSIELSSAGSFDDIHEADTGRTYE